MKSNAVIAAQLHSFEPSKTSAIRLVEGEPCALPDAATACVAVIGLGYVGLPLTLGFAKGSDYLIASCNDGQVRVYPTDTKVLAEKVCPSLSRNMTKEEWRIYVGTDIDYESTCKSLLIKDF